MAGWAPAPVWTSAENLAPTEIRFGAHPALASRYTDWAIPAQVERPYLMQVINGLSGLSVDEPATQLTTSLLDYLFSHSTSVKVHHMDFNSSRAAGLGASQRH